MVNTKTKPIQETQVKALVHDFFKEFQNCCNHPSTNINAALEKLIDPKFELVLNGRHVCKNLTDYSHFIEKLKKHFANLSIVGPNDAPILADNQVIVQYDVNLTPHQGQKRHLRMMAIANIDGNRITKWEQVSHEKR